MEIPSASDSSVGAEELYDLAPVGFVTTDRDEIARRVNRTVLTWTGFSPHEILGQRWSDALLTLAGRLLAETHVRPLLAMQQEVKNIAIDLRCADGRRLPVLLTVIERLGSRGARLGFLITFVEAIDREQYQRVLLEAKHRAEVAAEQARELAADLDRRVEARTLELQRTNEELDSFAQVVSHDLRAPLRRISSFSRILNEEYRERLDSRGVKALNAINGAADTLSSLIHGLLRLSLTSRGDMHVAQCDLSALAERIREELQQDAPSRVVHWTIEPHLCVWADPGMMEAALRNLLGNAWKYTAKVPDARIVFMSELIDGERVFRVSDNGAGFDMTYAKHLFEPFQRMHSKDEFAGLGIGLATVRRVIQRHSGTITANAVPNQGATFSFTLPATNRDTPS